MSTRKDDDVTVTLVDLPDQLIYQAAGLTPPARCGVCGERHDNLADEHAPDGTPIKVCAGCRVGAGR